MIRNQKFRYDQKLRERARQLRKEGTLGEALLWERLRGMQLRVRFRRQVPIGNYIVDFYCHTSKLVIEIDGSSHEIGPSGKYDVDRQHDLESLGSR